MKFLAYRVESTISKRLMVLVGCTGIVPVNAGLTAVEPSNVSTIGAVTIPQTLLTKGYFELRATLTTAETAATQPHRVTHHRKNGLYKLAPLLR